MSILKDIVANKREEIEQRKRVSSTAGLEAMPIFKSPTISFKEHLLDPAKMGIVAEFKRQSPSKGTINANAIAKEVAFGYENAGASALSVLTERSYFNGCDSDLVEAKSVTTIPIIRKDFVIDLFQIAEAKALGADAILLIAAILEKTELEDYLKYAYSIGLDVLVEVHDEREIDKLPTEVQIVGVNSRNLNTFNVDINHTVNLINLLPKQTVKVAESGISGIDDYMELREIGFNAFLIGEFFMKQQNPSVACMNFITAIKGSISKQKQLQGNMQ